MTPAYEISKAAEEDWFDIVRYTLENFGERQVQKYTNNLLKCLKNLTAEIGPYKEMNVSTHKVLVKRCQNHYIFALDRHQQSLLIIASLHERMNLIQRLNNRLN